MTREDGHVVEERDAGRELVRKGDLDRVGIGRGDLQLAARDPQRVANGPAGLLIVRRIKREHHIIRREWMAVRELHVLAQLQRGMPQVLRGRPAFGQPGLELLRGLVDPDQLGLREGGHEGGGGVARGETIEAAKFVADGGNDCATAPERGRGARGPGVGGWLPAADNGRRYCAGKDDGERETA